MKRILHKALLCLAVFFPSAVSAQSVDTLTEASVFGARMTRVLRETADDSLRKLSTSASDYLSRDSRFSTRQYAPGSVATAGLSGASSEQTRVLWDGIDISSGASGVLDLSLIPGSMVNDRSIVDGINSAAKSSLGIGGAINLESRKTPNYFSLSVNSIGGTNVGISHTYGIGKNMYSSILDVLNSTNSYKYMLGPIQGVRSGMGYSILNYRQHGEGDFLSSKWSTDLWFTQGQKENSGSVLVSRIPSVLEDKTLRLKFALKWGESRKLQIYGAKEWQSFTDTIGPVILDTNTYEQFTVQYEHSASALNYTVELRQYWAGGTSRDGSLMLPVFNMSYRPKSELFVLKGGVLWFKSKPQGSIYLHTIWSSKNIDQALKLGTFYRVPTLNEMYWNPGGNSELKTEQALGLKYTFKFDKILNFRFTTDQSIVSNLIQWTPGASGYWTPENQKRVYLGTSSAILSRRFGSWEIGGNATHNLSKILRSEQPNDPSIGKMLIYRPVLQSIATVEYRWDKSSVQFRYNHVGKRYTLRDNDLSGILSSEDWLNFSYNTIISSHIRLSARIENVFNASRQQMIYYPLPGRYYSIQLLINDLKK